MRFPCAALLFCIGACGTSVDKPDLPTIPTTPTTPSTPSTPTPTGPGVSWTVVGKPTGALTTWFGVAYGNGTYVAVGNGARARSSDGSVWTSTTVSNASLAFQTDVTFANGVFVDVGGRGISVSSDGASWNSQVLDAAQSLFGAAYGNGKWVVADDHYITEDAVAFMTSSNNGVSWQAVKTNIAYAQPTSVTFGNGIFVVVGYGGLVATSPDGAAWTRRSFGTTSDLGVMAIAYGVGKFVAVTNSGAVFYSTDGTAWTKVKPSINAFWGIAFGNGRFVGVGEFGRIYISSDAVTWTRSTWPGPTDIDLEAVTYGNSAFVTVGDAFAISK